MGDTISDKDLGYEEEMGQAFKKAREAVNTPEEIALADKCIRIIENRKAEMQDDINEWMELEELYAADIEDDDETEYGFVNIVLPTIEGQVSAMTQQDPTAKFQGIGFSDQKFARSADIIFPTIFRANLIRPKMKRGTRRYTLLGNMVIGVSWDSKAWDDFGIPEFRALPIDKVFFDGKIKDMIDYQKGDYVAEEIAQSIEWAQKEYGEGIAQAITLGNADPSFDADKTGDDDLSFTLYHYFRRHPETGNLQLLEISRCGVLCRASDPDEPYHKYVHNDYPYFPAGLYPREGRFYCFGDGKLLKPLQKILNNLYHEVILACKFASQRRTFIDPQALVDPADFDQDPSHPIMAKNPHQFIYDQQGAGINAVVLEMIQHLLVQAEKMTRFSALMTGNNSEKMTATQAGIQQQQGVSGVDDKRADISTAMGRASIYGLGLCMQYWPSAKAFRITEGKDDFEWIDVRQMASIPEMVPADEDYKGRWRQKHPHKDPKEAPKFMQLEYDDEEKDADGNPVFETDELGQPIMDEAGSPKKKITRKAATKQVDLDATVSIGEGLPTNKVALYNIILSLAQLNLPDERTGQMRPLMSFSQVRKMIEDLIGIKIEDYMEQMRKVMPPAAQTGSDQGQQGMVNVNPNIPGANLSGSMSGAAQGGGGMMP